MKAKLLFLFAVLTLSVTLQPAQSRVATTAVTATQCSSYCSRVRCIGDQICGLYTNSTGQTVCGCHPRF